MDLYLHFPICLQVWYLLTQNAKFAKFDTKL